MIFHATFICKVMTNPAHNFTKSKVMGSHAPATLRTGKEITTAAETWRIPGQINLYVRVLFI
jgi:hypothetical protein